MTPGGAGEGPRLTGRGPIPSGIPGDRLLFIPAIGLGEGALPWIGAGLYIAIKIQVCLNAVGQRKRTGRKEMNPGLLYTRGRRSNGS